MVVCWVSVNFCKQRKQFWNKLDTLRKMNSCLISTCLWWLFEVLGLDFSPLTPHLLPTFMGFFYSSLHHDSHRGSIIPSLHFLFHEPVSMFKIWLNFSSGLVYLVQDISHAHLFLRFQQGSFKRLPSFSRKNSHCKDKSLAERFLCSPENLVHHSIPGTIKGLVSHVFLPALRK